MRKGISIVLCHTQCVQTRSVCFRWMDVDDGLFTLCVCVAVSVCSRSGKYEKFVDKFCFTMHLNGLQ